MEIIRHRGSNEILYSIPDINDKLLDLDDIVRLYGRQVGLLLSINKGWKDDKKDLVFNINTNDKGSGKGV